MVGITIGRVREEANALIGAHISAKGLPKIMGMRICIEGLKNDCAPFKTLRTRGSQPCQLERSDMVGKALA